ncbi:MAG TPA: signal peptidase II [Phenylobacterium sp.]|jgi:signal peptidase II|uniref:signal peptidase II n=1 Tax=Phenylobacterium sp. TaxID=1871053 RepID=UPI002D43C23B|nr:signal peptidase II [Phenylobacterium sp.]HZZ68539.1 signal peptidase II [Phenylobacterium sp.]
MSKITKLGWMALALAVVVVVADQAVKYWILQVLRLQEGQSVPLVGPIRLTGVWNPGVSFGFLQAQHELVRWLLAAFSVVVAVILAVWVRATERPLFAVAIGLVMGGAVGNVIDRIRIGAVADFIDASQLYFPWIFNLADSAISIGICLLLVDMLRQDGRNRATRTTQDAA